MRVPVDPREVAEVEHRPVAGEARVGPRLVGAGDAELLVAHEGLAAHVPLPILDLDLDRVVADVARLEHVDRALLLAHLGCDSGSLDRRVARLVAVALALGDGLDVLRGRRGVVGALGAAGAGRESRQDGETGQSGADAHVLLLTQGRRVATVVFYERFIY